MEAKKIRETELYAPVKKLLEAQGYLVKGEVGAADIVARRGEEEPVIVELKTGFTLTLLHQAIERQRLCESVYVAVPRQRGRAAWKALKSNLKLCRLLGLGFMTVRLDDGFVETHADPGPYQPRLSKPKRRALIREFEARQGDPNLGGSARIKLVTAYRQSAISCAQYLAEHGPTKAALVAKETGVERARPIMADNHYGWFARTERGIYGLTSAGVEALDEQKTD